MPEPFPIVIVGAMQQVAAHGETICLSGLAIGRDNQVRDDFVHALALNLDRMYLG
jgi:hypothetical protein